MAVPGHRAVFANLVSLVELSDFRIHHRPPLVGFGRVDEVTHEDRFATEVEADFPAIATVFVVAFAAQLTVSVIASFH